MLKIVFGLVRAGAHLLGPLEQTTNSRTLNHPLSDHTL